MNSWKEINEGYFHLEDGSWSLYLSTDDSGALLEVYDGTSLATTANWGPAAIARGGGPDWCKRQSLKVLDSEKKKKI
jgi:hypothetical protein